MRKKVAVLIFFLTPLFCLSCLHAQDWQTYAQKADSLTKLQKYTGALLWADTALFLAENNGQKNSQEYFKIKNIIGKNYIFLPDKKEICQNFLFETDSLTRIYLGENHTEYANSSFNLGLYFQNQKQILRAKPFFLRTVRIRKNLLGEENPLYISALDVLGRTHFALQEYEKAKEAFHLVEKYRKEKLGEKHQDYFFVLNNLTNCYNFTYNYKVSEIYGLKAIEVGRQIFGEKSAMYARALSNMAIVYSRKDNFDLSEKYNLAAMEIRRAVLGEKHEDYMSSMNNLGVLYHKNGDYAESLHYFEKVMAIREEINDEEDIPFQNILNNLAAVHSSLGNTEKSLQNYLRLERIYKKLYGEMSLDYSSVLTNLSSIYSNMGCPKKAEKLQTEACRIKKELTGEKLDYANALLNLAHYQRQMQKKEKVSEFLYQAQKILLQYVDENHPDVISVKSALSENFYMTSHKKDSALILAQSCKNWALVKIKKVFPVLSEKQKEEMFNHQFAFYFQLFNSLAFENPENNTAELYDLQLATKAILLQATQKIKNRILNSQDTQLISHYNRWLVLHQKLADAEEMTQEELREENISLDSLHDVVTKLEKMLAQKSESFSTLNEKKVISWRDVQKKLKKNEAAVEIVRFNHFGYNKFIKDTSDTAKSPDFPLYAQFDFTDTVYYAAMIVKKNSKVPELILLKNGNDLENKYQKYQKNAIIFKREDTLSYTQIWQPIAERLKNIQKVYFSPDGVYNQIALDALYNPKTKKYLMEELDLHLLSNTNELLSFSNQKNQNLRAELLGFPTYEVEMSDKFNNVPSSDNTRALASFQKVSPLPGTLKEVEKISDILLSQNFQLQSFIGQHASEENVKKLHNPKILHLSTHGFFVSDNEKKAKINPMLRSGLLLAGVSNYMRMKHKPDTEDGILTALEAANLTLDSTDLVVLAACETGLGDVKTGEGVFGLRRAFKVAGAKSVIMSLWKVDDAVTQKLMIKFYQKLFVYGETRRAFREAQAEIKKEHPEPYYWAAFIIAGE